MVDSGSWIGRPVPKAHSFESEDPPTPRNPALRGYLLCYLTKILVNASVVQWAFYHNAGFTRLRNRPELKNVDPRYDPAVIKTNSRPARSLDAVLSDLAKEDFKSRVPPGKRFPSALDYHEAYKSGVLTPTDIAETLLPMVRRDISATNHSVAFVETQVELVRAAAAKSTLRYKSGKPLSPLDGVPVVIKDQVDLEGYRTRSGSTLDFTPANVVSTYCVAVWEQAGAVVVGKTSMHELGLDTTNLNPNPGHGTPLNPYNNGYFTGGSSGGSAYALAAGLVPIAHGADGGGSIRIPSGFCGVYGLKTSHKRVSERPTTSIATSVGVHGPMAANMVDLEIAYRVMGQPDSEEATSALFVPPMSSTALKTRKKLLGIDRAWFNKADPAVREACQRAIDWLVVKLDYEVVEITLPLLFDGQLAHAMSIVNEIAAAVPDISQLTAPNKILLKTIGTQATGIDLTQAQKMRNLLMQHLSYLYTRFPGMIIVSPTTPNAGWSIVPGDLRYGTTNANMSIKTMTYVYVANFTGTPAIAMPVGYAEANGGAVPISLMGMGEWCTEDELLAFGYDCERYLHEGVQGGRRLPPNWVDIFGLAKAKKPDAQ